MIALPAACKKHWRSVLKTIKFSCKTKPRLTDFSVYIYLRFFSKIFCILDGIQGNIFFYSLLYVGKSLAASHILYEHRYE